MSAEVHANARVEEREARAAQDLVTAMIQLEAALRVERSRCDRTAANHLPKIATGACEKPIAGRVVGQGEAKYSGRHRFVPFFSHPATRVTVA